MFNGLKIGARLRVQELRDWLKEAKLGLLFVTVIVVGSAIFTYALAPSPSYQTMISILTTLIQLAGVLISFTAVVAVQILTAYRSQLEHTADKKEVGSRRKKALVNVRMTIFFLVLSVLIGVVVMAQLSPERSIASLGVNFLWGLFFLLYSLLAGVGGLFVTMEDL